MNSGWTAKVAFAGATDPVLTIVVSTGGPSAIERFAVTGCAWPRRSTATRDLTRADRRCSPCEKPPYGVGTRPAELITACEQLGLR
jgi:hypothetical protein